MHSDNYIIEKHPFDPYVLPGVQTLIIGTLPTHQQNMLFNFYYSGKENNFWMIMQEVFKTKFLHLKADSAIREREIFLRDKKIGLTDMHEICYRRNGKSSDSDLFVIRLKDVFSLLNTYESIERIILTSRTEVFGALGLLKTYFIQQGQEFPSLKKQPNKILEGEFEYNNRKVKILVPYSPSPRLISGKRTTLEELIEMYRYCLTLNLV